MSPLSRKNTLAALALLGLAFAGVQQHGSTVLASNVCASATTYVVGVGEHDVPPVCVPYNNTTTCNYQQFGLAPSIAVTTSVCVPRP